MLPNFLIVGAPKSGSTALYHYLAQHPEVFMASRKEPRYFVQDYYNNIPDEDPRALASSSSVVRSLEDYECLFRHADHLKFRAFGEASIQYLYLHRLAIPNILSLLGKETRILIILRNPVDRAYSSYLRALRDGFETLSFEESIIKEEQRKNDNWSLGHLHTTLGFYAHQVKAYTSTFPHTKVLLYNQLRENPHLFIQEVFQFLGVDASFQPSMATRYNVSGLPKNRWLHTVITRPNKLKTIGTTLLSSLVPRSYRRAFREKIMLLNLSKVKPKLSPSLRASLIEIYRSDILELQAEINLDLERWLS